MEQLINLLKTIFSKPSQPQTQKVQVGIYKDQNGQIQPYYEDVPINPTPKPIQQTPRAVQTQQPIQTPTPIPQTLAITPEMISKMIQVYGGNDAPLLKYAPTFAQTASQYDFWKNNPELLALIPHLETSSGKNVTRPNNVFNWGINYPGNNEIFRTMEPETVAQKAISGIGEKSPYYKDFRTGRPLTDDELLKFANIYEPANSSYGPNLVEGRKHIREVLGQ